MEDIIGIQKSAWATYPESYRPISNPELLRKKIIGWRKFRVFGAFGTDDGKLHAYAYLEEFDHWASFAVLKADPEWEKMGVNAAMVAEICEYYNDRIEKGFYICDGERNTVHETMFQDYLIKYFGFRRAYCKLNLAYRKPIGTVVNMLYPFRDRIARLKDRKPWNKVNAVLFMEKLSRDDGGINAARELKI